MWYLGGGCEGAQRTVKEKREAGDGFGIAEKDGQLDFLMDNQIDFYCVFFFTECWKWPTNSKSVQGKSIAQAAERVTYECFEVTIL